MSILKKTAQKRTTFSKFFTKINYLMNKTENHFSPYTRVHVLKLYTSLKIAMSR
jgi:hypothetical protein